MKKWYIVVVFFIVICSLYTLLHSKKKDNLFNKSTLEVISKNDTPNKLGRKEQKNKKEGTKKYEKSIALQIIKKKEEYPLVVFNPQDGSTEEKEQYNQLYKEKKCYFLEDCDQIGGGGCNVCGPISGYKIYYSIPKFGLVIEPRYTENSLNIISRKTLGSLVKEHNFFSLSGNIIYDQYTNTYGNNSETKDISLNPEDLAFAKIIYLKNTDRLSLQRLLQKKLPQLGQELNPISCKDYAIEGDHINCYFGSHKIVDQYGYYEYSPIIIFNEKGINNFIYYVGETTNSFKTLTITNILK